ncbi:hypothetical protein NQ317_007414 [Molorchus minor]|uniref:Uncharacterized protein n=1 Tax=Molorchus minor TaxID=1323400 RepID=A0ABQ9IZY4_9CUCU|nr:hypothetical protein NQ317_007414 [Molorchus minor]
MSVLTTIYAQQIPILRQELNINPKDGTHNYLYETGNRIYEDQQGYRKAPGLQAVQGQFQYESPEGENVNYI